MIFCSLVAAGAGGAAGGAMLILWPAFVDLFTQNAPLANLAGALAISVLGASFFALYGIAVGAIIGVIPSFLTGFALTLLSRWPPFRSLPLWTVSGAIVGLLVISSTDWREPMDSVPAWVAGGAAAMMAYWGVGLRVFKLKLLPHR
jgi:hypothetical protein